MPTPDPSTEFLLKDFEHWAASYATNEELGEKRLTLLTGLVAAVLAGLAALATENGTVNWARVQGIATPALAGLLVFGVLTLLRVLRRNCVTQGYLHAMATVRRHFLEPELVERLMQMLPMAPGRPLWNGGLKHVVMVINCGLAALLWMSRSGLKWTREAAAAALVMLSIQLLLDWLLEPRRRHRQSARLQASTGLLVMNDAGKLLAMKRRDLRDAWQLPQGGILAHETPEEAAWRELEVHTGLRPQHVELVRTGQWHAYELPLVLRTSMTGLGAVQKWFLFRMRPGQALVRTESREVRQLAWMPFADVAAEVAPYQRPVYAGLPGEFPELTVHEPRSVHTQAA